MSIDPKDLRILFLRKKDNKYAHRAELFVRRHFPQATIFSGSRKDKLPVEVLDWSGDMLISFISSWIYPQKLLANASMAAINFHPGSPEYPGTGCTNFAIYNRETEYGVTCHHMATGVDSGKIIAVRRFSIGENDSVYQVTQKCYELIEQLFYEIMEGILNGRTLPESEEFWKRKPYTRKQLDDLCTITPDMSEEEVDLRIKATTYQTPWAFTKIGKHIFKLQAERKV
jgi:methionyl-tRNA formyltransferase